MKISNNALTFLLAQYRAIFKQAYIKGLAPAVLLTAALAAGQAQAAAVTLDGSTHLLPVEGQTAIIDNTSGDSVGSYENGKGHFTKIQITSGTSLVLGGELRIERNSGSNTADSNYIDSQNEINITGNTGILTIDINEEGTPKNEGLLVGGNGASLSINIGTICLKRNTNLTQSLPFHLMRRQD